MSIFKYNVYTQDKINAMKYNLLPENNYEFEVIKAENGVSKKGNDMLIVQMRIFSPNSDDVTLKDYFVNMEVMAYKIRDFLFSLGMREIYEGGEITPEMLIGKKGYCRVGIEKSKDEKFWDRNVVKEYLESVIYGEKQPDGSLTFNLPPDRKTGGGGVMPISKDDEFDDDIPF